MILPLLGCCVLRATLARWSDSANEIFSLRNCRRWQLIVRSYISFLLQVLQSFVAESLTCSLNIISRYHLRLSLRRNYVGNRVAEIRSRCCSLQVHHLVATVRLLSRRSLVLRRCSLQKQISLVLTSHDHWLAVGSSRLLLRNLFQSVDVSKQVGLAVLNVFRIGALIRIAHACRSHFHN